MAQGIGDAGHEDEVKFLSTASHVVAHSLKNCGHLRLQNIGGNPCKLAGLTQDRGIGVSLKYDSRERHFDARDFTHGGREGLLMYAVAAAQQGVINVEQVSVL